MPRQRDRNSGMGLLPLMEARPWKDGKTITYRYRPIGQKPINLGQDKDEAIRRVLDMNGASETYGTLLWAWEDYQQSRRWQALAPTTKADYESAWRQINARLGHMHVSAITTPIISRYVHVEREDAPKRANTEKALLSRLFGHAIKKGVCSINPTIGVEPHQLEPRTTLPDSGVLARFLDWLGKQSPQRQIIGMMASFCSLAGSRRAEFLHLQWDNIDLEAGEIRLPRAKQRGSLKGAVIDIVQITPPLHALLLQLRAIQNQRGTGCAYVFPNQANNKYTEAAFKTLWGRCMSQAVTDGVISQNERFRFHDLRAYYATKHKELTGTLPELHANPAVTARVYNRQKEVRREALISHGGKLSPSKNEKAS